MSGRAARRSRGGAEFGAGLTGVGRLDDPASAAEGFFRQRGIFAEGQGFRAVHFVEMGFVDFGCTAGGPTRARGVVAAALR